MLTPRPYQSECHTATLDWFHANSTGNPVIVEPCGAGKSLQIAMLCAEALQYENQKVIISSHIQELIEQNSQKFHIMAPEIDYGIYCAALNKKQIGKRVTFVSIQSAYKKAAIFGFINLLIIDESHMLSDDENSQYRTFINELLLINPKMRIVGYTATDWRTRTGLIYEGEGAIFTAKAHEISMNELVSQGYLCRLVGRVGKVEGDRDSIGIARGDFIVKEAESVMDEDILVRSAISDMLVRGADRKTWLIFAVSVKHAEHICTVLNEHGIESKVVSAKTPKSERQQIINDMRQYKLRCAINVRTLTTGTDIPNIDLIGDLAPTESPGLVIQKYGRGSRPVYAKGYDLSETEHRLDAIANSTKPDCLILDYSGNLRVHGPVTHISSPLSIEKRGREKENKGKCCPQCEIMVASHLMECLDCHYIFPPQPRKVKHSDRADSIDPMSDEPILSETEAQWYTVKNISYEKHIKATMDAPPSMCVIYKTGVYSLKEWIPLENLKARHFAVKWWMEHSDEECPKTVDEAIEKCRNGYLDKVAAKILVKKEGKYPRIVSRQMVDRLEWTLREKPVVVEEHVVEGVLF